MSTKSTSRTSASKPKKPRKDFPLSIHKGTGYWCKKVRGQVHYFGKVEDDPKGAQSAISANIPTIHYRYSDDMPPVIEAAYSCYNGVEFINYMNKVIHG